MIKFLMMVLVMAASAWCDVDWTTRAIDWQAGTNVGVPGGIPVRTAIYQTLDSTTSADAINAAITACPKGQVVQLDSGTFLLDEPVLITSDSVTLRGRGITKTRLIFSISNSAPSIHSGEVVYKDYCDSGYITSGYAKGSTKIVVTHAPTKGTSVGDLIRINQLNDTNIVWSRWGSERLLQQIGYVTACVADSIWITPPLAYDFSSEFQPRFVTYYHGNGYPVKFSGLEDFKLIQRSQIDQSATVKLNGYANWVKNVEIDSCSDAALMITDGVNLEITGCLFKYTTATNEGYAIQLYTRTTGILIENNSFTDLYKGIVTNNTIGSVMAYNYADDMYDPPLGYFPHQTPAYSINHEPHGIMNLWEGNIGQGIQNDGYHGSNSHATLFRNNFHGLNDHYTSNRKCIDLCRFSRYHNVIGNVLGDPTWEPYYIMGDRRLNYTDRPCIYRFGFPNMGDNWYSLTNPPSNGDEGGLDPLVETTLFRWGNYDDSTNTTRWEESEIPSGINTPANHDLPTSLYRDAKPSWWITDSPWPPIGSDLTPLVSKIPAQLIYKGYTQPTARGCTKVRIGLK